MSSNNHYHEDMLSVEEARDAILKEFSVLETDNISLLNCMEMVLAEDITSTINKYEGIYGDFNYNLSNRKLRVKDIIKDDNTNISNRK